MTNMAGCMIGGAGCVFNYQEAKTPNVTTATSTFDTAAKKYKVSLTGNFFGVTTPGEVQPRVDNLVQSMNGATTPTDTAIDFFVTAAAATGQRTMQIKIKNLGYARFQSPSTNKVTFPLMFYDVNPPIGSQGGSIVTFSVAGVGDSSQSV